MWWALFVSMKKLTLFTLLLSVTRLCLTAQIGLKDAYSDYFSVGVAVNVTNVTTPRQESLIRRNFNSLTAEDDMKPIVVHPSENVWDWSKADVIADFCRKNGIKLRGHVLAWHSRFCDWMFVDENGQPVSKERFYERLRTHIHTVMNRYKDIVYAWDVVNEAIAEEGEPDVATCPYRKSKMYLLCGEEYIAKAFEFAHEVDSTAILIFNDYNTVIPGKRERMYNVVKKMIDAGVPITGIGMQGHYNLQVPDEAALEASISKFATLVDHIHISELDLSCLKSSGETVTEAEKINQKKIFAMYFKVFRKYSHVIDNVTFWNLYDRESWIGSYNYPLLFDENLNVKDAYYSIRDFKTSNVSDPFIAARLEFKNSKTYVNSYADYLDSEGFSSLASSLRDYVQAYPKPEEKADAYLKASEVIRNQTKWAQSVADGYLDLLNEKNNLETFADKTHYPGYDILVACLKSSFPERSNIHDESSLTPVRPMLRAAKKDYLFSQDLKAAGRIVVSKMIQHPWFCEEEAEPVSISQGIAKYYVDWPKVYTNNEGWTYSASPSISSETTSGMGYYQSRTAWFSRHHSNVVGGDMVLQQAITDLPEGFYSASADLITDELPTDDHVFVISSSGTSSKSPVLSGKRWDSVGTDIGQWETLSTDKIFVGNGDTLYVGVKATTNGQSGNGTFFATNFQLICHDSNLSSEIIKATEQLEQLMDSLMLKGDYLNASYRLSTILSSSQQTSGKFREILKLTDDVKMWLGKEKAFTALSDLRALIPTITDSRLRAVAVQMDSAMTEKWNSEETTYLDLPAMSAQTTEFFLYTDVVPYAQQWQDHSVVKMLDTQLSSLSYATMTKEVLAEYTQTLRLAMKNTMESLKASASSPLDVTFLLTDPSFKIVDSSYWQGTKPQFLSGCVDFTNNKSFDMYQVLRAMPAGVYRLESDGLYRDGNAKDAYSRYPSRSVSNAKLYLNNYSKNLTPWMSVSNTCRYSIDDYTPNGVFYYPMTAESADKYFKDGFYTNSFECQVNAGDMIIGLAKTLDIQNDWTVCDNFRLYYLGKGTGETDDAYYVTVGEKGNVTYPFWTTFSDYYTIKDGFTGHFRFMNYSDMAKTWNNWMMAVTNRPDHNTGLYSDYKEFFIIRADAYGWGSCFSTGTMAHDYDFKTFCTDMNGAMVDLYVSYIDGKVNMSATITTDAENPDLAWQKQFHYYFSDITGIYGDWIYVYFSVEKANLQGFNPIITEIEDEVITEIRQTGSNLKYSITGIPVDDNYRGVVIQNGKKKLIK